MESVVVWKGEIETNIWLDVKLTVAPVTGVPRSFRFAVSLSFWPFAI